jgi:hypothetical protein
MAIAGNVQTRDIAFELSVKIQYLVGRMENILPHLLGSLLAECMKTSNVHEDSLLWK